MLSHLKKVKLGRNELEPRHERQDFSFLFVKKTVNFDFFSDMQTPDDLDSKIHLGVEETLIFDESRHISDSVASEQIKSALNDVEYFNKDHAEKSIEFYKNDDKHTSRDSSTAKKLFHMHRIDSRLKNEILRLKKEDRQAENEKDDNEKFSKNKKINHETASCSKFVTTERYGKRTASRDSAFSENSFENEEHCHPSIVENTRSKRTKMSKQTTNFHSQLTRSEHENMKSDFKSIEQASRTSRMNELESKKIFTPEAEKILEFNPRLKNYGNVKSDRIHHVMSPTVQWEEAYRKFEQIVRWNRDFLGVKKIGVISIFVAIFSTYFSSARV